MKPSDPFSEINDGDRTIVRPSPGGRRLHTPSIQARQPAKPQVLADAYHAVDAKGDNPLLANAFSLLSLVPKLRNLPYHSAINELQERLVEELKRFENHALNKGTPRNHMDIAKYLLCALLDETVLNTPWGSRSGWGHNSLSSLFYRKVVGGEEFFQILDRLKQQPSQNRDLLELAYLCLSLGFEGKYRYTNNGLHALERQRHELYLLIQKIKGDPEPELSVRWRGLTDSANPLIRYVPLWVLAGVAGVTLLLAYMMFAFAVRDRSDGLYDELFDMSQSVKTVTSASLVQPLQSAAPAPPSPNRFKGLLAEEIAQNKVALIENDGLRIFNMFHSGSADVRQQYQAVLSKIAQELQAQNAPILIVGHTDNQRLKLSSRFKSNWHLSMARAESAAKALGQYGLPGERMRFEAMADKAPIRPNTTPTNRALNRRIDIYVR